MANRYRHFRIDESEPELVYIATDLPWEQIKSVDGVTWVWESSKSCYEVRLDPRYGRLEVLAEIRDKAQALHDEQVEFIHIHLTDEEAESLTWDDAYRLACERDADAAQQLAMSAEPLEG